MIALETAARGMSDSVTVPVAECTTFTFTSSLESFVKASVRASIEP
jgi:hypothetical protein